MITEKEYLALKDKVFVFGPCEYVNGNPYQKVTPVPGASDEDVIKVMRYLISKGLIYERKYHGKG